MSVDKKLAYVTSSIHKSKEEGRQLHLTIHFPDVYPREYYDRIWCALRYQRSYMSSDYDRESGGWNITVLSVYNPSLQDEKDVYYQIGCVVSEYNTYINEA